ncbi:sulfotransferase [Paracoccus sp. PARArs4]|uniref:sulfotransferase family protein n=1 Tax=Paracoccus sp. PARArs4 TaxID=2853442 RepID=UPI0024A6C9D2|nr:sulfotransferase [Paracoccus sp. PARArs4]
MTQSMLTISPAFDPEGAPRKPGALCIGAQKAGTSWLAQMLGQHPQVWIPPFKEVQYFNFLHVPDHQRWIRWHYRNKPQEIRERHKARGVPMPEALDAYLKGITGGKMFHNQWYKRVFAPAPVHATPMDFTPEYSTLPAEGVAAVARLLLKARVVYLVRDPVDRAISQLRMNLRRAGREPATVAEWMTELDDPVLFDRGDYASYIPRWQAHYPDMLILPFGRIATAPHAVLEAVEDHLGIGPMPYANMGSKVFANPRGLMPPPELREELSRRMAPQYDFLRSHMGPDFMAELR